MKIILYNTNTPTNALTKQLENGIEVEGALRDSASILTPSIAIEAIITPNFNYCYIPSFNRYYFITDITRMNNKLIRIDCKVDVLMSYADEIKQANGIVKRQENANPYYKGYITAADVRQTHEIKEFENNFNETGALILLAVKGVITNG